MAYEMDMMQALIDNDQARIDAIRRLNTPGSYIKSSYDESHDKLVAGLSQSFRKSHEGFCQSER